MRDAAAAATGERERERERDLEGERERERERETEREYGERLRELRNPKRRTVSEPEAAYHML